MVARISYIAGTLLVLSSGAATYYFGGNLMWVYGVLLGVCFYINGLIESRNDQ